MSVYVDTDTLKKTLTLEGTTFRDDDLDEAAVAASAQVERMLNRDFGLGTTEVSRYYTAHDPMKLVMHDLVSLDSLMTDDNADGTHETTWATTDYVLAPFNAATDDQPYTEILLPRYGTKRFPSNVMRGVKVTGIWGWPSPPMQVVTVSSLIATQLVKRKVDAPWGFVIGPESAAYIARSDPTIQGQLHDLGRKKLQAE